MAESVGEAVPTVGRVVHYVAYGSDGGRYPKTCRAAMVTEAEKGSLAVSLAVLNPTGMFFNQNVPHCSTDHGLSGGTWHWPERVGPS